MGLRDGASVTDPSNIETERMQVVTRSILHVPGCVMDTKCSSWSYQRHLLFNCSGKFRRFHIYTPPGLRRINRNIPCCIFARRKRIDQSGVLSAELAYSRQSIADRAAVPMIVVMPNGHVDRRLQMWHGACRRAVRCR